MKQDAEKALQSFKKERRKKRVEEKGERTNGHIVRKRQLPKVRMKRASGGWKRTKERDLPPREILSKGKVGEKDLQTGGSFKGNEGGQKHNMKS